MTLFLPTLEGDDASSIIVKTLSQKRGLNARQIHSAAQARGAKLSYQGVHKALQKLLDEGVVEKLGKGYILSQDWINSLKHFTQASESAGATMKVNLDSETWPQNLQFNTLIEIAQFALDFLLELTRRYPEPVGIGHWKRCWPGTIFSREDFAKLNEIMKRKRYLLINGNSFADKLFASYFEKMENTYVPHAKERTKHGVPCATDCDLLVEADYIAYIYFSTDLKKKIDEVYAKIDARKQDLAMRELFELIHNYKANINVIVNKNAKIAEQIREETLQHFK